MLWFNHSLKLIRYLFKFSISNNLKKGKIYEENSFHTSGTSQGTWNICRYVTKNWYRYGDNHLGIIKNLIISLFDRSSYDIILVEGGLGLPHAVLKKIKNSKTKIILLSADTLLYELRK